ncbi:MAG: DUF937 domain-containing protein [Methylovirgula sp.]|jgi:hypothetical protein
MFNLSDIVQNAQNGKAIDNLAQQFGITPEQAQAAVQAIIPALSAGLMQKLGQPGALGSIISAVTDSTHQASFANPEAAQSTAAAQKGTDAVNDMFGSSHIVHQIAQQISNATGLRSDLIMQMIPVVASIVIGGIAAAAQKQGWGGMLGANAAGAGTTAQTAPGQSASSQSGSGSIVGALIGMMSAFLGAATTSSGAPASGTAGNQSALDNLGKMFQPGSLPSEIIQSGLPDEIGKILAASRSSS